MEQLFPEICQVPLNNSKKIKKKKVHSTAEVNGTKKTILTLLHILANSSSLVSTRSQALDRACLTPPSKFCIFRFYHVFQKIKPGH